MQVCEPKKAFGDMAPLLKNLCVQHELLPYHVHLYHDGNCLPDLPDRVCHSDPDQNGHHGMPQYRDSSGHYAILGSRLLYGDAIVRLGEGCALSF